MNEDSKRTPEETIRDAPEDTAKVPPSIARFAQYTAPVMLAMLLSSQKMAFAS